MHYEREDLGFSFDLPNGWRRDEHNLTLTFYGPKGGLGIVSELIQIQIGGILPQYFSPENREQFLAEPDAQVFRTKVGDETNAVVLKRARDSEISVVRDGVHYTITHCHDSVTKAAIEHLKQTARFPSPEQARTALRSWSDPRMQALSQVLRASSPEEARSILTQAGMPGVRTSGGTIHDVSGEARESHKTIGKGCLAILAILTALVVVVIAFALLR
jgi:hypothetical protein